MTLQTPTTSTMIELLTRKRLSLIHNSVAGRKIKQIGFEKRESVSILSVFESIHDLRRVVIPGITRYVEIWGEFR